jgi:hypothetical protein
MEAKHTPGPWVINGVLQNSGSLTIGAPEQRIVVADVHNAASLGDFINAALAGKGRFGHQDDASTQWANAQLIAAAPDTLAALVELVWVIDRAGLLNLSNGVQLGQTSWYVKASDRLEAARTAIAKTEGC